MDEEQTTLEALRRWGKGWRRQARSLLTALRNEKCTTDNLHRALSGVWGLIYPQDPESWDYPGQVVNHTRVELQHLRMIYNAALAWDDISDETEFDESMLVCFDLTMAIKNYTRLIQPSASNLSRTPVENAISTGSWCVVNVPADDTQWSHLRRYNGCHVFVSRRDDDGLFWANISFGGATNNLQIPGQYLNPVAT